MTSPPQHRIEAYGVELCLARDKRELATLRRRLNIEKLERDDYGATFLAGSTKHGTSPHLVVYINVAGHDTDAALVDTIAHETIHATLGLFDYINAEYDGDSEPLAYLAGFIAAWTFDHCQDTRR